MAWLEDIDVWACLVLGLGKVEESLQVIVISSPGRIVREAYVVWIRLDGSW
jgi:hypothetical protein